MISLDFLQLKYFLVAAEYEHMTKAAQVLHIAQPALSQSIKHLEEELGVSLFDRINRGVRLSTCGKRMREELIPIMETLDSLPGRLKETNKIASQTIQLNILAASVMITQSIISFKKIFPEVNFRLLQDVGEEYDVCITCTASDVVPKDSLPLLKERILLAVPKDSKYACLESISLEKMALEGFISFSGAKPFRLICDEFCRQKGFQPKIIFESDNQESVRNLIDSNLGVAFWPEYTWGKLTANNSIQVPINDTKCSRTIYAIRKKNSINSIYVEAYLEHLLQCIEEIRKG